jgi:hypothetical protein
MYYSNTCVGKNGIETKYETIDIEQSSLENILRNHH